MTANSSSMDAYLERLFAESFKREVEQEETVIRSLPCIAAAAAIIVAVIREVSSELTAWSWDQLTITLHALLILSGGAFAWTGWFVFQALRRRPFRYPRGESEIRETARRLIGYHRQALLAAACRPMASRTPAKPGRDRYKGTVQSSKVPATEAPTKPVAGSALRTKPHLQAPRTVIEGSRGRVPSTTRASNRRDRKA